MRHFEPWLVLGHAVSVYIIRRAKCMRKITCEVYLSTNPEGYCGVSLDFTLLKESSPLAQATHKITVGCKRAHVRVCVRIRAFTFIALASSTLRKTGTSVRRTRQKTGTTRMM